MNKPLLQCLITACLFFLPAAGVWAEDAPSVRSTPIAAALHLIQGRGGNVVASVGQDGILLVDGDYSSLGQAYASELAKLSGDAAAPRFVLNTHWHDDHTGNNGFWGSKGAVVVGHDNIRVRMSTRQQLTFLGRVVEPSPAAALPMVTYGDSLALHFNGDDIEVQHFPRGHTDGDSVVFFARENVVHLGDLLFLGRFPFVDLESGGSVSGYIANVAAILARVDAQTVIVPGHGAELADRQDLQDYHDMLVKTRALVTGQLEAGSTVDAIVESGLGSTWAPWGAGFINEAKWIQTIAASH